MKIRIRPAILTDLASSYRLAQSSRASSSASTSTSTSPRKPGRPRRPDIPDELREQGIAPEVVLTSTTGGAPMKSYRPAPAWVVHSNGEEPHLRANPWADTYKIDNSELEAEFDDTPQGALDRGMKMLDQVPNTPGTETRQSAEDLGTRRERYRPHSFGLSTSRASSSRGQGQSGKWAADRAVRRAEEDAQNSFAGEGPAESLRLRTRTILARTYPLSLPTDSRSARNRMRNRQTVQTNALFDSRRQRRWTSRTDIWFTTMGITSAIKYGITAARLRFRTTV
jgi:hypothetical protein